MLLEEKIIDSADSVSKRIKDEIDVDIKSDFIRVVMTRDMGMSYRKILKGSYHSNSSQSLILR